MHPKNSVKSTKGFFFDWENDYKNYGGHNSDSHVYLKKKSRRAIRRDGKRSIKDQLIDHAE